MKIVADEGVDRQIVERLRHGGLEVQYIAESDPGITDEEVLALAREHGAVLITGDKDFGELVFRQHLLHTGVVLIRLPGLEPDAKAALVASAIDGHAEQIPGSFSVLTERIFRIRRPV